MFYAGKQIGAYKLVKILGRGGFGEVWLAERHAKFVTTKVAVKLPLAEQVDADSIKQEAVLWEHASGHPNVLPIIDADEYDGQIVIVSEFAPDGTLDELLRKKRILPVKRAVELTAGILNGLEFLHNKEIIHRDIKPANILLQGDTPRLADFGMSRVLRGNSMSVNVSGTPFYMAPEAFNRKRNVQTDIWSVGVVLYRMLAGQLPFQSENPVDLMSEILVAKPPPMPDHVPERLQEIVAKALAKMPENRYGTAREMREDLMEFLAINSYENVRSERPKPEAAFAGVAVAPFQPAENRLYSFLNSEELGADSIARFSRVTAETPETDLTQPPEASQPVVKTKRRFSKLKIAAFAAPVLLAVAAGFFFFFKLPSPIPFRKGDKFGYSRWDKKIVLGAKYDLAFPFSDERGMVALGKHDEDGNFIGKYGFIDRYGREIVPLEYDYAESFSDNLALVAQTDAATGAKRFGFIDANGKVIVPLIYEAAASFSENLAAIKSNGKWGFINANGQTAVPFKYDSVKDFSEGYAAFEMSGKFGLINSKGQEIVAPAYEYIGKFSDGKVAVKKDGKAFFIDANGVEAMPFKYNRANRFSEGFAYATLNGKSGFITSKGNEAIAFKYENENSYFSEGLAAVKYGGKYGFITKGGETIIPFKYAEADSLKNNIARVKNDAGKEFYIGNDGTEFYEP